MFASKHFSNFCIFFISFQLIKADECFKNGETWNLDGQIGAIPQITSVADCITACIANDQCNGYTWYGSDEVERIKNLCILFDALDGTYACENCVSGKTRDAENCFCMQEQGECLITDNNLMSIDSAKNELECLIKCYGTEGCFFYTWYGPDNEAIKNGCFLFSECDNIEPCGTGCNVGQINCK